MIICLGGPSGIYYDPPQIWHVPWGGGLWPMFGNHLYNSTQFADFQGLVIHKIKAILALGSKCKYRHFVLLRLQVISFPSIKIITLKGTFDPKHFRPWEFKNILFTYFDRVIFLQWRFSQILCIIFQRT